MGRRRWWWLVGAALVARVAVGGCGHSEDEWQAKVREIDDLKTKLDAEQAQAKKARAELDESTAQDRAAQAAAQDRGRRRVEPQRQPGDAGARDRGVPPPRRAARRDRSGASSCSATKLAPLTKQGLAVTVRNNRVMIQLPGDVLFDAGRETLKRDGREMLLKVAEVDPQRPEPLGARLPGRRPHRRRPLAGGRFKDNWGLSLMRAREVLALLVQPADKGGGGLNPSRWSAAGYGDTDPLKSNDTPEGKQANRRCELVVLPNVEEMLDLRSAHAVARCASPPSTSAPTPCCCSSPSGAAASSSPVLERATITRLGQGVDATRALDPEAVERDARVPRRLTRPRSRAPASTRVAVVGTSAMRDARGGEGFVARARALLGVEPRVDLRATRRPQLTFAGALVGPRARRARDGLRPRRRQHRGHPRDAPVRGDVRRARGEPRRRQRAPHGAARPLRSAARRRARGRAPRRARGARLAGDGLGVAGRLAWSASPAR